MPKAAFVPVKKRVVLVLLAAVMTLVIAFAGLLRWSWRTPVRINAQDYAPTAPETFVYSAAGRVENGAYILDGWACVAGERIEWVECWAVLYDPKTDTYWRLPTAGGMDAPEATALLDDGILYSRAGLTAVASLKKLAVPPDEAELCFLYLSNGHDFLMHTGQQAMEGAA